MTTTGLGTSTPAARHYVGRFAPSPSGPLHFGSLVAALGSYLDARCHHGRWLVRIEDIDTPRVKAGADTDILKTLEAYALHWHGDVVYQSQRLEGYQAITDELYDRGLIYRCQCTRKQIKAMGGIYDNRCRNLTVSGDEYALRLVQNQIIERFEDRLQGEVKVLGQQAREDYIIKRRDGLFAYQLVVVIDDIDQGITDVVRGADLLIPSARQIGLFTELGATPPSYMHLPLAVASPGFKLSKQNYAPAIERAHPQPALLDALRFLGFQPDPELLHERATTIVDWAVSQYPKIQLRQALEVQVSENEAGNTELTTL